MNIINNANNYNSNNNTNSNISTSTNNNNSNSMTPSTCGFYGRNSAFPINYMFGQSYVPIQYINETFRPEVRT